MPQLATAETRTLLEQVSWETFLELAEGRRGSVPRMTFDQGVLELMTPRRQHESIGCLIGRLVETYSEVRGIEILSCASTTFKRPDLARPRSALNDDCRRNSSRGSARSRLSISKETQGPPSRNSPLFATHCQPTSRTDHARHHEDRCW